MSFRFKRIVVVGFVLLIALPFTAPVHNCDLRDLLGIAQGIVPSAVMPITTDSGCDADAFTSPIESSALSASASLVPAPLVVTRMFVSSSDLPSSLTVQHTVLRL